MAVSKGIGIGVLGLGLLGLGWWAHGHHGPRIEDHVRQLAETAVASSIHGAAVTVSGRDIHLSGIADSKAEAEALGDEEVDDAQRKGDARAALEDLVEEAVARVGVVLEVAVKAPLVEHDPVDDATFLAGGRGFDDQFAAPGGDGVELGAAATDLKVRVGGAGEKEGAGFQFVVERADEVAEFADGIAEF